jgi:hypothetical protein
VSNAFNQAERYLALAEEFRRLAAFSFSTQMQNHYSDVAEHYRKLAEAAELGTSTYGD